jgi:hypothetical protein
MDEGGCCGAAARVARVEGTYVASTEATAGTELVVMAASTGAGAGVGAAGSTQTVVVSSTVTQAISVTVLV